MMNEVFQVAILRLYWFNTQIINLSIGTSTTQQITSLFSNHMKVKFSHFFMAMFAISYPPKGDSHYFWLFVKSSSSFDSG